MFDDFDVGSDWGQMFDGSGLQGTSGLLGALGSVFGSDGTDYSQMFDGSGLEGSGVAAAAQEGSPNIGGVSDPEATRLLSGSGDNTGTNFASKVADLFKDKKGDLDLQKLMKVGMGVASFVNSINNRGKQAKAQQSAALQQQLQQAKNSWTPQQSAWATNFFQTPMGNPGVLPASQMASPIVAGRGYAHGGDVEPVGALGLVYGEGGGQDDMVEARLSPGEYVFDADTVSMIGDGSNEAGAQKLDMWRQALRAHKRSAPDDEIPPPAEDPMSYMPQGGEQ